MHPSTIALTVSISYFTFTFIPFLFFHIFPPLSCLFSFILWAPVLIYKIMFLTPFFFHHSWWLLISNSYTFTYCPPILPPIPTFCPELSFPCYLFSVFLSFLFIHSYSHIFMSLSAHLSFLDLCFAAFPFPKHQFSLLLPKLTQYVLCIFILHSLPSSSIITPFSFGNVWVIHLTLHPSHPHIYSYLCLCLFSCSLFSIFVFIFPLPLCYTTMFPCFSLRYEAAKSHKHYR